MTACMGIGDSAWGHHEHRQPRMGVRPTEGPADVLGKYREARWFGMVQNRTGIAAQAVGRTTRSITDTDYSRDGPRGDSRSRNGEREENLGLMPPVGGGHRRRRCSDTGRGRGSCRCSVSHLHDVTVCSPSARPTGDGRAGSRNIAPTFTFLRWQTIRNTGGTSVAEKRGRSAGRKPSIAAVAYCATRSEPSCLTNLL